MGPVKRSTLPEEGGVAGIEIMEEQVWVSLTGLWGACPLAHSVPDRVPKNNRHRTKQVIWRGRRFMQERKGKPILYGKNP